MHVLNGARKPKYRHLSRKVMGAGLLFCLFLGGGLRAETGNNGFPPVVIVTVPAGLNVDKELLDLVSATLAIEVERAGYSVTLADDMSDKYESPVVMTCSVSRSGNETVLEFNLNIEGDPGLTFRNRQEGRIDLGFDSMIVHAVSDILGQVEASGPELIQAEPVPIEPVEEKVEVSNEEPIPEPEPIPEAVSTKIRLFRVSAGAAPFLAVGKVNYYFSIGILSSITGGYTFRTTIGDIETGVFLGVQFFEALGLESASSNILVPMGGSVRYGTDIGRKLQLFITVTGGPALFFLLPAEGEQLFKVTGYAGAGGGGSFLFSDRFGLTVEIDYMLFFERYYPIMGVVPSVSFDVRF